MASLQSAGGIGLGRGRAGVSALQRAATTMTRDTHTLYLDFLRQHNILGTETPLILDVGSCLGWFAQDVLSYFPHAHMVGFDLDPRAEQYFAAAAPQGTFHHLALSDYDLAKQQYWLSPQHFVTELGTLYNRNNENQHSQWIVGGTVNVRRLDGMNYLPNLVKIDAELADLRVVLGMAGLLKRGYPQAFIFELVDQTDLYYGNNANVLATFEPYGYVPLVPQRDPNFVEEVHHVGHFAGLWGVNNLVVRRDLLPKELQ